MRPSHLALARQLRRRLIVQTAAVAATIVIAAATAGLWMNSGASAQALRLRGNAPKPIAEGRAIFVRRMDPSQMLRLTLVLQPPNRDELEQLARDVQDPASPRFRQFLTFDEWKARYAPSDSDVARAAYWAGQQGLSVIHQFRNNLALKVEANAETIERAFDIRLNHYTDGTRRFYANDRDPAVPAELSGLLKDVQGLESYRRMRAGRSSEQVNDDGPIYRPGPFIQETPPVVGSGSTRASEPRLQDQAVAGPTDSILSGGSFASNIEVTDLYTSEGYDLGALQRFSKCCNPNNNAGGSPRETSIAIIGEHRFASSDLVTFFNKYGLAYSFNEVFFSGAGCCDDEMTMDMEVATAFGNNFARGLDTAHVTAYEGGGDHLGDLLDAWHAAHSDDRARSASSSFGSYEDGFGGIGNPSISDFTDVINAMAAEGWTIAVATGDHGATDDCQNYSVHFPASSPNVIAAGGSTLTLNNNGGKPQFSSEVAWGGPGCNGQKTNNNFGGGGGGCSNTEPRGLYQLATLPGLCGNNGKRSLPDVALNAGSTQWWYYAKKGGWLNTGGGTSIVAPELAGFFAQMNSYLLSLGNICGRTYDRPCAPAGPLNTTFWAVGNARGAPNGHNPFYDITSGNNGGDKGINAGYSAGPGYDQATGWGSFNMLQMAWVIVDRQTNGTVPQVQFTGPPVNTWFRSNKFIDFTVVSPPINGTSAAVGIAGFSAALDTAIQDVPSHATPGSGDAFYDGPQYPGKTTGSFSVIPLPFHLGHTGLGCHTVHVLGWDNAGRTTGDEPYGPVCYDPLPPTVACADPDPRWHANNVRVLCVASDQPGLSGLAAQPTFFLVTTVPAGQETDNALTGQHDACDKAGNCTHVGPLAHNKVDRKPPVVLCGGPDALWHATDVTINCTASDGGSGLANSGDANFGLSTLVPAGTETALAFTVSYNVLDAVGNTTTAGPIGPNRIDKKPPTSAISRPTAGTYTHSSTLVLNYRVTDGGSGVATVTPTMNGNSTVNGIPLTSGTSIPLLTNLPLGPNVFSIRAIDKVGNAGSESVTFTIIATPQSIIDGVHQLAGMGAIDTSQVNSLIAKLNSAKNNQNQGQCGPASTQYQAFIDQVNAASGKSITAAAAAILIGDAQYLIAHCTLPGLVSWWHADGDATDALGVNNATNHGALFVPGRVGQAFGFGPANLNAYVEAPSSPSLRPAAVTVMAWVKNLGSPGQGQYVLAEGAKGCFAGAYALYTGQSGNLSFYVSDGGTFVQSPDASAAIWDGNWHLAAGAYDGTAVRLYIDGVEVGTGTPASLVIAYTGLDHTNFDIGAFRGSACTLGFTGAIDEVRLFNRGLSAAEILDVYQTTAPSGLVSWWQAEGNAADALGVNNGSIQGTVGFAPGRVGQAFSFTGTGYVDVVASPSLQPAAVTAMAWVRHAGFPGFHNFVLSKGADRCVGTSYGLTTSAGVLHFEIWDGTTFAASPHADASVWDGNWHLVAGTYDGAFIRLYVDGAEVAPGIATPTPIAINTPLPDNQNFYIGAYRGQCELRFNGDIDEVKIFNRALSAPEIVSIYQTTP